MTALFLQFYGMFEYHMMSQRPDWRHMAEGGTNDIVIRQLLFHYLEKKMNARLLVHIAKQHNIGGTLTNLGNFAVHTNLNIGSRASGMILEVIKRKGKGEERESGAEFQRHVR